MSKKRPGVASSPGNGKTKKPKTATGALDSFFTSPSKKSSELSRASTSKAPHDSPASQFKGRGLFPDEPIILDDDDDLYEDRKGPSVIVDDGDSPFAEMDIGVSKLPMSSSGSSSKINTFQSRNKIETQPSSEPRGALPDLTVDPLVFQVPLHPWTSQTAPYSFLSRVLAMLSQTRSRILMLNILTNALRMLILHDANSIVPSMYMISNSLAPPYVPVELGLGPMIIIKALQAVSGLSAAALRKLYHTYGDPGDVAFAAKASVRTLIPHPPLTIQGVYASLIKISQAKGEGAAKQRQSIVERLLLSAKGEEVRFIGRTLSMHLRVGAVRTTLLTALARAGVLTRAPGHTTTPPPTDSPFFASDDLLKRINILSLPEKGKTKKKKKASEVIDEARGIVIKKWSDADSLLRMVFVQHPNYDDIVKAFLTAGWESLVQNVPLTVGIPLHPTLGSPMRSFEEIYERLGELAFAAEFKYDGQRAQIHATFYGHGPPGQNNNATSIKIFSRHLEDMTEKYPDVVLLMTDYCCSMDVLTNDDDDDGSVGLLPEELPLLESSFILDAEIVGWDSEKNTPRSFQELSNRPRKDVHVGNIKLTVSLFVFDIMYLNGKALLSKPFRERRKILREKFPPRIMPPVKGGARLQFVQNVDSDGPNGREGVEAFWEIALESRCEGLMVKLLDSGEVMEEVDGDVSLSPSKRKRSRRKPLPATYEPDKRTSAWLKLKKDYVDGIGDSLDLVPIGAWHGNGRKAKWWSPILLAVWDPKLGRLVALCKCMSGFTDEFYTALNERYPEDSLTCSRETIGNYDIDYGGLRPTVYFLPREVWEIRGADITISPVSVAALGEVSDNRGLSLRFPRFIRVRQDKAIEDATQPSMLADIWRRQSGSKPKATTVVDDGDLVDFEYESENERDSTTEEDT